LNSISSPTIRETGSTSTCPAPRVKLTASRGTGVIPPVGRRDPLGSNQHHQRHCPRTQNLYSPSS
jgi:hypothetical protein